MRFVTGGSNDPNGQFLAKYFAESTGNPVNPPYSAIGFVKEDKLAGVAIFNDYTHSSIEMHLYAPNCFCKKSLKYVFNYIFNELKCNIFIAKPYRSNKKLSKILGRMGGKFCCVIDQYYGPSRNEDAILYSFNRQWAKKWIKLDA